MPVLCLSHLVEEDCGFDREQCGRVREMRKYSTREESVGRDRAKVRENAQGRIVGKERKLQNDIPRTTAHAEEDNSAACRKSRFFDRYSRRSLKCDAHKISPRVVTKKLFGISNMIVINEIQLKKNVEVLS